MIAQSDNLLGIGIYTPAEAAFYARLQTRMINRWVFGNKSGESVIESQLPDRDEKIVTFLDFVQTLAVREIRTRHRIDLQRIREAVDLAKEHGIQYPFAREHTAYLFGDPHQKGHGEIVLEIDGKLMDASGPTKKNLVMRPVAQLYLQDLVFSSEGLAEAYTAWTDTKGRKIVMDPHVRFGEPVIADCGYTAQTLWEAYQIEGGIEAAAEAYGVDRAYIELSLRYYDHLLDPSAA